MSIIILLWRTCESYHRVTHAHTHSSASELRRRKQREDRKERLTSRLNAMKDKDQLHQQQQRRASDSDITSELSVPWLILGFAVVVGYCIYYICT